jgi:trehalose 6-phosphate phosphatase
MPKPLLQCLPEVDERIRTASRIALFLDFDGTLTPIVDDPATAQLTDAVRDTLCQIVQQEFVVMTIISGRAVEDVFVRIRMEGVVYAGNHGLEIFGRDLSFVEPEAAARRDQLRRLSEVVAAKLRHVEGVRMEDKGLTTSIHYRQVAPDDYAVVEDAVRSSVAASGALFRLNTGRKVFEIVPRTGWHKGAAAQWIMGHLGEDELLPIYLGDDNSDEDAFAVLRQAVTVRVGNQPATGAHYRVAGPPEVHQFLSWLTCRVAARSDAA